MLRAEQGVVREAAPEQVALERAEREPERLVQARVLVALEREAQVRLERPLEAQQVPVTALQADRAAAVAAALPTRSEVVRERPAHAACGTNGRRVRTSAAHALIESWL